MRTVFTEQIKKWICGKRFGSANTGVFPTAIAQQFEGNHWADCGLPQNCL
jgi:hypothetical protein